MAAIVGGLTGNPKGLKKWAEIALIGTGLIGCLVLVVILYLGLGF